MSGLANTMLWTQSLCMEPASLTFCIINTGWNRHQILSSKQVFCILFMSTFQCLKEKHFSWKNPAASPLLLWAALQAFCWGTERSHPEGTTRAPDGSRRDPPASGYSLGKKTTKLQMHNTKIKMNINSSWRLAEQRNGSFPSSLKPLTIKTWQTSKGKNRPFLLWLSFNWGCLW